MKMASQRFCLRWNNHQSNLLSVFDQLLHAETFTDVTLAVDGQYLKAHKMVLSACSPYFNALFVNHPEKHPIVILKDVPYSDMKSLLDFMYRGEVSVDQERLTAFLRVAESLRIKGLTEVNDDKPSAAAPTPPPPPQLQRIQPYLVQQQQQQHQQHLQHQQRQKSQASLLGSNSTAATAAAQQSLLSSALASMPKRKRGRPRKLSGSSNGTGNDYDEFEREGMLNDSEMGDSKLGNDSFSGNDDGSDDNQRDTGDNADDLNESRSSVSQMKKSKLSKDQSKAQQNDDSTSDGNDSDGDNPMDTSYMEPQLMLDEYDEPVEFKFDPNASANSPSSQDSTAVTAHANITQQQARQQALLLAAQQKHQQQLVEAAAAAAGGMKMSAVVGAGPLPNTVTLYNSMVSIPKLAPIVKSSKPKVNKRAKLKQNGVSGSVQGGEVKPYNSDYMDLFSNSNFGGSGSGSGGGGGGSGAATAASASQSKAKSDAGGSTGASTLNVQFPPASKIKLNTSGSTVGEGEAEGSVRDYCTKEVQLVSASPELSQRLFGLHKHTTTTTTTTATVGLMVQQSSSQKQQQQQQTNTPHKRAIDNAEAKVNTTTATTHLPTVLGLKVRNAAQLQQQPPPQSSSNSNNTQTPQVNSNSLLKQQLRAGLKEIDATKSKQQQQKQQQHHTQNIVLDCSENSACSALQSLANVAERQTPNTLQPPSANNLHHQFLLHMAANPMLHTSNNEYLQQQKLEDELKIEQEQLQQQQETDFELFLERNDKSEPELTLADESAGLDYKSPQEESEREEHVANNSTAEHSEQQENCEHNKESSPQGAAGEENVSRGANTRSSSSRPVQRRRIRRKAQSTLDDQAEHLTEMSVRGLDLFRYARMNEGVYQCTECAKENVQKTFKNKYSFQRHAFLYHEGKHRKVFPCPMCGKEFSRPDKMKNHLKMVHDNYVSSKELNNFNPLNYLISAAAAGDMHGPLFSATAAQQQTAAISAAGPATESGGVSIRMSTEGESGLHFGTAPTSPSNAAAVAQDVATLHKLQSEIVVKNEIVISPSPSPPPLAVVKSSPTAAVRASAPRLEEVK